MSEFHYVRTLGVDGGVDACEGPAIGLDLETVLQDGLPPWNVSLEIIAALCEILDIAAEDGEVHGEVSPRFVFIDETGAVSLEGYGIKRSRTLAPEGTPKGPRSDLYGLGRTAFSTCCSYPLPSALPDDDPDAHDDTIIDAVLEVDLEGLPEEMQGDIQWFLAKLMAFDREDRPSAVEAWRTFIAFASEVEGPDIAEWCAEALDAGGERRVEARGERTGPVPEGDEEDLGGPVVNQGFFAGGMNFDTGGASAKGGATAFWTKEDMKKALDRSAVDDDDEGPPMGVGGGTATNFWSRDQLAAMTETAGAAPRPKRNRGAGERRRATSASAAPNATKPPPKAPPPPPPSRSKPYEEEDGDTDTVTDPAAQARTHAPPKPPAAAPQRAAPPVSPPQQRPPAAQAPQARRAPPQRPTDSFSEEPEEGSGKWVAILGGSGCAMALFLFVLAAIVVVVIGVTMSSSGEGTAPPVVETPQQPAPALPQPSSP